MRVEPITHAVCFCGEAIPVDGHWVIAQAWQPARYFCIILGGDGWSKHLCLAKRFPLKADAESKLLVLRRKGKSTRERGLTQQPKPRSEVEWTTANKKLLVQMFTIGCKPEAMAVQFGRTAAACRSMFHLMLKRGNI